MSDADDEVNGPPEKNKGGRKPRLTEQIVTEVENVGRLGLLQKDIAKRARVSTRAMDYWMARGRAERERVEDGAKPRASEALYLRLVRAVDGGNGDFVMDLLTSVKAGALKDPVFALEVLERVRPEYRRTSVGDDHAGLRLDIETSDGGHVGVSVQQPGAGLTRDDFADAAQDLLRRKMARAEAARAAPGAPPEEKSESPKKPA